MATGRLGATALSAGSNATIYTVPSDTFAVVTVNITNRSTGTRAVRLALAAADSPATEEYLEFDTTILANGVLERGGIVMDAGKKIVCRCDSTDVNVVVYGIETPVV